MIVRLQSHVWVSALIRAEQAAGAFAAILRRGNAEAGAIFVLHDHLDGTVSVYAPAPQSMLAEDPATGRIFETPLEHIDERSAQDWLDKQIRFDSDCWIVAIEKRVDKLDLPPG
jgi:hypothetical protein